MARGCGSNPRTPGRDASCTPRPSVSTTCSTSSAAGTPANRARAGHSTMLCGASTCRRSSGRNPNTACPAAPSRATRPASWTTTILARRWSCATRSGPAPTPCSSRPTAPRRFGRSRRRARPKGCRCAPRARSAPLACSSSAARRASRKCRATRTSSTPRRGPGPSSSRPERDRRRARRAAPRPSATTPSSSSAARASRGTATKAAKVSAAATRPGSCASTTTTQRTGRSSKKKHRRRRLERASQRASSPSATAPTS
mmetsp:Transcript_3159/g.12071  ORF Transcript_3159/g.12071 Transcript_3159/m.12071 type:complete len:257 (-) Transcript_3159:1049-1819(-)